MVKYRDNVFKDGIIMKTKSISKMTVVILIIAILFLTSSCSYDTLSSKNKTKIESYSQQLLQQAGKNVSLSAEKINTYFMDITLSQTVQEGLNIILSDEDDYEKLLASRQISEMLTTKFMMRPYIVSAEIVNDSGYSDKYSISDNSLDGDIHERIIQDAKSKKGSIYWTPMVVNNTNVIIASKEIKDISSGKRLGTFIIELKESYFSDIYKSIDYGMDSSIFIIDSNGKVVSTTDDGLEIAEKYKEKALTDKIIDTKSPNNQNVFFIKINEVDEFVVYSYIPSLNWYIVGVVPIVSMF
jgi:hypothetical protein